MSSAKISVHLVKGMRKDDLNFNCENLICVKIILLGLLNFISFTQISKPQIICIFAIKKY